ncbi:MAG: class I SAM-dependent methyltransferase [Vicinamibacterales bacterium]
MSQITTGLRAVLSSPRVYDTFQRLMGGHVGRTDFATTMVRARAGMRVLDVGCGTGDLLGYLPEGVVYDGWDPSSDYIDAARQRFGARGRFHTGLLGEEDVHATAPYDVVIASGVLHHLDDGEVVAFGRLAFAAVRSGGRFVSIDPVIEPGQHPVARYLIARDRGQHVRSRDAYVSLLRQVFPSVTGVLRHRRWVPYTHWMMEATRPTGR